MMGNKVMVVCDYPVEGRPCQAVAQHPFNGTLGNREFCGDFCQDHVKLVQKELLELGITALTKTADSKRRQTYVAKSGVPFSGDEARTWLIEQGYEVKPRGRINTGLLQAYADAH